MSSASTASSPAEGKALCISSDPTITSPDQALHHEAQPPEVGPLRLRATGSRCPGTAIPVERATVAHEGQMAAYQYIYVMKDLGKTFPGGKKVLENIWLSFLPGAKIGVLGPNGAGKSTLLKIMAGRDDSFTGEAWAAEGVKVGYLEQEPQLDSTKTVIENVMEGVGEAKALLDRFNEVSARFAEPLDDDEMNALMAEQG